MNKEKKDKPSTKYFVILFGSYFGNKTEVERIFSSFSPILSSEYLKFHYETEYAVAYFETKETPKVVKRVCVEKLCNLTNNFFIVPNNKNLIHSLSPELESFLKNLDDFSDISLEKNNNIMSEDEDKEFFNEFLEGIWEKFGGKNSKNEIGISLDEILDKITESGVESLTKKEINKLYEYSNRI